MNKVRRKICVVTGSRAEFGLLRLVIKGIHLSRKLDLQLIVTGTHLSPEFGLTVDEIEADGLYIDRSIEMLLALIPVLDSPNPSVSQVLVLLMLYLS